MVGVVRRIRHASADMTSDQPLICAVWAGDLTGNGAQVVLLNYRVNSGGGTAKDFLLINDELATSPTKGLTERATC